MDDNKSEQVLNQQVQAVGKPGGGKMHRGKGPLVGILLGVIVVLILAVVLLATPLREIVFASKTAPVISLELVHGTGLQSDDGSYIFEVMARVKGNPKPFITFNRNDRFGETEENRVLIILEPGEVFTLVGTAVNSLGQASDALVLQAAGLQADVDNGKTEEKQPSKPGSTTPSGSGSAALPDLVITTGNPTVTPATVLPGGTVTLSSWTVKNQGTNECGSFTNGFYLSTTPTITSSDTYLGGNSNNPMAPGDQFTWGGPKLTIPAGTTPGTYYIGILADRNNTVAESNENNNYVSQQITITAFQVILKPDLVITTGSPTVTPATVLPGGTITLSSWTVKNQGLVASGPFENGFYLSTTPTITASDTFLTSNSNASLPVGDQFTWGGPTLTIPLGTAPGTYYIGILVDRNNTVAESNENNNYVSQQIAVTAFQVILKPDLVITTGSPTATPLTVAPGGKVNLSSWTVKNQGLVASGPFENGFYLSTTPTITTSDTFLTSNSNASLPAGDQFTWGGPTLTIPLGTAPGTYYIGILVDRNNTVNEYDETNNYVSRKITVSGP